MARYVNVICICGEHLGYVEEGADDLTLMSENSRTLLSHCEKNHKSVYEDIKRLIERHADKEI